MELAGAYSEPGQMHACYSYTGRKTEMKVMDNFKNNTAGAGPEEKNLDSTQYFKVKQDEDSATKKILAVVYEALSTKGYDPVNQIVGYIMSGDPTYITNYMGARSLIMKVERDELVEEIMESYIRTNHWA